MDYEKEEDGVDRVAQGRRVTVSASPVACQSCAQERPSAVHTTHPHSTLTTGIVHSPTGNPKKAELESDLHDYLTSHRQELEDDDRFEGYYDTLEKASPTKTAMPTRRRQSLRAPAKTSSSYVLILPFGTVGGANSTTVSQNQTPKQPQNPPPQSSVEALANAPPRSLETSSHLPVR